MKFTCHPESKIQFRFMQESYEFCLLPMVVGIAEIKNNENVYKSVNYFT